MSSRSSDCVATVLIGAGTGAGWMRIRPNMKPKRIEQSVMTQAVHPSSFIASMDIRVQCAAPNRFEPNSCQSSSGDHGPGQIWDKEVRHEGYALVRRTGVPELRGSTKKAVCPST